MSTKHALIDSTFNHTDTLAFSFWMKIDPNTELIPSFRLIENDVVVRNNHVGRTPNILDGWLLIEDTLKVVEGVSIRYEVSKRSATIGRIQIHNFEGHYPHQEDGRYFMNNIPLN